MKEVKKVKKSEKKGNGGVIALIICGILTIAIIITCIFFPDEFFGIFIK